MIELSDYELRLLALTVRQESRVAASAVLALAQELVAIPDRVSEELLGHIRLQWWRDQIEQGRASESPILPDLLTLINSQPQIQPQIMAIIDGFAGWLSLAKNLAEQQPPPHITSIACESFGRVFALLVQLQTTPAIPPEIAAEVGRDFALARMISSDQIPRSQLAVTAIQTIAATLHSNQSARRRSKTLPAAEVMIARRLKRLRRADYDRFAARLQRPDRLLPLLLLCR
ncbi:MAG: squalene/phytoene synthase family protein [Candidatus Pacebacteria bacterium]|nr:squalene/phytoene synthase family protein [Candidatus Paceibacterota bacterium]